MKKIGRTCNVCQNFIPGGPVEMEQHGLECHPNHVYNGYKHKHYFKEKNYFNPIDGKWYESRKWMARAIPKTGEKQMTNEEYYLKYGKEFMPKEWEANNNDPNYGNARSTNTCLECSKPVKFDEKHWEYPVFCHNSSCNVNWWNKNSNRVDKSWKTIREKQKADPNFMLRPTQLEYWLNKGFSEKEAKQARKIRQSTCSKEQFIERAGGDVEKGIANWAKRNEKWLKTKIKNGTYISTSEVSIQLFDKISESISDLKYGNKEVTLNLNSKRAINVDCIRENGKKVIEFLGDYWHANPKKYEDEYMVKNVPAREIWKRDASRIADLEAAGYEVLVVWGTDYKNDPEAVVQKCIDFLKEK